MGIGEWERMGGTEREMRFDSYQDSKTVCHNVSVSGVIFAFVLVFVAAAIVHFFFNWALAHNTQ